MYVYVCVCVSMVCMCVCLCVHVCICMCVCVNVCECMCVYMFVPCVFLCVCLHVRRGLFCPIVLGISVLCLWATLFLGGCEAQPVGLYRQHVGEWVLAAGLQRGRSRSGSSAFQCHLHLPE